MAEPEMPLQCVLMIHFNLLTWRYKQSPRGLASKCRSRESFLCVCCFNGRLLRPLDSLGPNTWYNFPSERVFVSTPCLLSPPTHTHAVAWTCLQQSDTPAQNSQTHHRPSGSTLGLNVWFPLWEATVGIVARHFITTLCPPRLDPVPHSSPAATGDTGRYLVPSGTDWYSYDSSAAASPHQKHLYHKLIALTIESPAWFLISPLLSRSIEAALGGFQRPVWE